MKTPDLPRSVPPLVTTRRGPAPRAPARTRRRAAGVSLALSLLVGAGGVRALGIDKLQADLDVTPSFRSVASFTVFNDDSDEQVMIVARGLRWEMDAQDPMKLTPTQDLAIFPPVQRVPAGGSATFRVRYAGAPPVGEAAYRILFRSIRIPAAAADKSSAPANVPSTALVGLSMTVPIWVADQSARTEVLSHVRAQYRPLAKGLELTVVDAGDRHVSLVAYRRDGQDHAAPLGVVQAGHQRSFVIDTSAPATALEVQFAYQSKNAWIPVTPR